MTNWLKSLFSRPSARPAAPAPEVETMLALQKEAKTLQMELAQRDQTITNLKQEIERLRAQQARVIDETLAARQEPLFADLAAPASQILTQADLLENQGKPLQARDVLPVARRMVRALERHGISFDGKIGEQCEFDPNRHTPLNSDIHPQVGQPVTIRFVGVRYREKVLYKAIVE